MSFEIIRRNVWRNIKTGDIRLASDIPPRSAKGWRMMTDGHTVRWTDTSDGRASYGLPEPFNEISAEPEVRRVARALDAAGYPGRMFDPGLLSDDGARLRGIMNKMESPAKRPTRDQLRAEKKKLLEAPKGDLVNDPLTFASNASDG